MKKGFFFSILLYLFVPCFSQEGTMDSVKTLDPVLIKAFGLNKPAGLSSVPVTVLTPADFTVKTSFVNGLNQIAGVRMEERSPGSYRINIRGSSLRSPFGIRNIKVYWNDIPVTDPGGNTYFNQFALNNFSSMEIFKGPAGSLYGAGTGGLILLNSLEGDWQPGARLDYITGSYNLQNIFASARFGTNEKKNGVSFAHLQSDGYRIQTRMRRDNFSWVSRFKKEHYELTASVLFTDMYYQTPGALTRAEFEADPRAARPAASGFPSAVNAKAAIYQKNLLAGFNNLIRIGPSFTNTTMLYGAFTQIKNPAIRNFERRNEPSFGGRTSFHYDPVLEKIKLGFIAGAEFQQGYFNTQVSKNKNGNPDTLQTNDDINNAALSVFTQVTGEIKSNWFFTGGLSLTKTTLAITRLNSYPVITQRRTYRNELAPKFTLMKKTRKHVDWLLSVSKGFSPPTLAEVLPSTGVISTSLEAEKGWNYETLLRFFIFHRKLKLELTGFSFRLEDALVQRRDLSGADYFVNAGAIRQKGIEFHADYKQLFPGSFASSLSVKTDFSYNHFRYGSFVRGTDDFSGKYVPSVPSSVFTLLADIYINKTIYFSANYYTASTIYLNDANTARAEPYHLLGCQAGWKKKETGSWRVNIYAGIDNLLDETYSLGNDINAAANRFYNAAPPRNYYIGCLFQWIKTAKK